MFDRIFTLLFILCIFSSNAMAKNSDNPFSKVKSLHIGTDISWHIDKDAVLAIKSASNGDGSYYHLSFNNKQLEFSISSDASGLIPKKIGQMEVKGLKIDGKKSSLFSWCLHNQEQHKQYLQQGLTVKNGICKIDSGSGDFAIRLNRETLNTIQKGRSMSIVLKPFRTQIELHYDISDFKKMYLILNARDEPVVAPVVAVVIPAVAMISAPPVISEIRKCWVRPPVKYKKIRAIEYSCADGTAKLDAETEMLEQVSRKRTEEKKAAAWRAAENDKQRKLAAEKKQKEHAARLKQEELLQAETAAIIASEAKQAEIGGEISQKMIKLCDKFWSRGEHRCYCQKYIEHAPDEIQKNSSCE